MVADVTGVIKDGRVNVTVADALIAADTIVLSQCKDDTAESAGGSLLENVVKTVGVGVKLNFSNTMEGDTRFLYSRATRTGTGTIPAGRDKVKVLDALVADATLVAVVLTEDAGAQAGGASVEWIKKDIGVGFTVNLSEPVENPIDFDYYIITKTGASSVPVNKDKVVVADAAFVSPNNLIYVSLTSNPGDVAGGAGVEWVDMSAIELVTPVSEFKVWLRDRCQKKTYFDYLIL